MISIRSQLLAGAALSLFVAAGPAHAEDTGLSNESAPLLLAQAEGEPQVPAAEPTAEVDPIAAADKAVEDARAALRDAMATGGDVRAARRNLQAAIKSANEIRKAAGLEPIEGGPDDPEAAEAPPAGTPPAETPPAGTPPAELPTLAVPETAPAELPTLAVPETPPAPPPEETPTLALPEAPPAELPTLALPETIAPPPTEPPPSVPPTLALPETPPALALPETPPTLTIPEAVAPPAATTEITPPPQPTPLPEIAVQEPPTLTPSEPPALPVEPPAPPAETAVVEPPPTVEPVPPAETTPEKKPGFFERLFGGGKKEPAETEEATAPTGETPPEAGQGGPVLPIFKELPPITGPKVVIVAPQDGEVVKQEDEKRVIVKEDGQITIKHDDNDRFRRRGEDIKVEKGKGGTTITTVTRDNGTQVVTVRDASGDILQRYRKKKSGEVEVLIGERDSDGRPRQGPGSKGPGPGTGGGFDFTKILPKLVIAIPQQQYVVGSQGASRSQLEAALIAPPVEAIERPYSLEEIQRSERLRAKLRRIDVDTVNFEFGAATIAQDQVPNLQAIGNAIAAIIANDPSEVFLIEGHTDAVGSNLSNLALSDRRAQSIAEILTYYFNIPPENLVTQGYGEEYLKVLTAGPERLNRRASMRRITPLLVGQLQTGP
jgi:outer membrane protein OmpA-like peptidoglycan-associated protein